MSPDLTVAETGSPAAPQSAAAGRRSARWIARLVPLCYLIAATGLTWRLWADPTSRTVAGNWTDADLFAWYLRYAATAVTHGHLPALVTSAMNAPQGVNLMWNTSLLLPGVLMTPVTVLFGPQASLTALTTIGFAGSATALYLVLRRWQVSVGAAGLAGAVYGFSPALLHSAFGHYNLQLAILPPLIIDAGLRLATGPAVTGYALRLEWRHGQSGQKGAPSGRLPAWLARVPASVRAGIWLGLLVTAQLFISEELALLTALAGALILAGLVLARPLAALSRIGPTLAGFAVGALVTLALAWPALRTQFHGPLVQHGPLFPPDYYVNDLTSFVTPSGYLLAHTAASAAKAARYQGGLTEYLAYLGWPLIVALCCAAVACWRRPAGKALTLTVAVLVVLSLGGHPLISGVTDTTVNLPWHWLEEHQLLGTVLPDRLSILADGAAAALLALGVDAAAVSVSTGRFGRRGRGLVLLAAVVACLPLLPLPLPAATATPLPSGWTRTFELLHLPPGAHVLVVPVPTNILTAAMRWQADTAEPAGLVGGYFIGPGAGGQAYIGGAGVRATAWYLDRLWACGLEPDDPLASVAWAAGLPTAGAAGPASAGAVPTLKQESADFAFWRPAAVVAVTTAGSPLGRYLIQLLGQPTAHAGRVLGWRH